MAKEDLIELEGKVDAIVMEKPVAEMAVKTNPELAVGKPTYEEESGGNAVGVAKGNEDLLAKVNEVINQSITIKGTVSNIKDYYRYVYFQVLYGLYYKKVKWQK